jgi:hypothetical protein
MRTTTGAARPIPSPAFGGYVVAEIPAVRAVVLAGVLHPYALGALDLDSGAFHLLDPIGRPYHGLVATTDGTGVLAFGHSEIVELRFQRGSDGTLTSEILAAAAPDLGHGVRRRAPAGRPHCRHQRPRRAPHLRPPTSSGSRPSGGGEAVSRRPRTRFPVTGHGVGHGRGRFRASSHQ